MMRQLSRRALCSSSQAGLETLRPDVKAVLKDLLSLRSDVAGLELKMVETTKALDLKIVETTKALDLKIVEAEGRLTSEVVRTNATSKASVVVFTGLVSATGLGFACLRYYDTAELKKELERKDTELKRIEARRRERRAKKHAGQVGNKE